jgi:hypothetical protein
MIMWLDSDKTFRNFYFQVSNPALIGGTPQGQQRDSYLNTVGQVSRRHGDVTSRRAKQ